VEYIQCVIANLPKLL